MRVPVIGWQFKSRKGGTGTAFSLWEKVARLRRMRGLEVRVCTAGAYASGRNPLIRPSGTFSQRQKTIEPQLHGVIWADPPCRT